MSESPNIYQAIVTKVLPATNTKPRRIKAAAYAGSITVAYSKLDGDNGKPAIVGNENQHKAVARMLMDKYKWAGQLHTGRLPNGDYAHVQTEVTIDSRIFAACFPAGIVYADTKRERHGDYVRLAFLSYATLKLDIEPDCPKELRQHIIDDAAKIQARKGEQFQTAGNQYVTLGKL